MQNNTQTGQTRARILAAVHRLLETEPYSKVTMRRIAQESGLGLGTFYKYYTSKDEILHEVIRDINEELRARIGDELDVTLPATERYRQFVRIHCDAQKRLSRIESAFLIGTLSEHVDPVPEEYALDVTRVIRDIFEDGVRSGEFRSDVSFETFSGLYLMVFFGGSFVRRTAGKVDIEKSYAESERALLSIVRIIQA